MTQSNPMGSPTGRTSRDAELYHGRMSSPLPLTAKQSQLLAGMVNDQLTLGGRTFSRSELLMAFRGDQVPKDPDMRKLLDIDFGDIERRVMATFNVDPAYPYGRHA